MNCCMGFTPSRTPAEAGGAVLRNPVPPASSDPNAPGDRPAGEPARALVIVAWFFAGVGVVASLLGIAHLSRPVAGAGAVLCIAALVLFVVVSRVSRL